MYYIALKCFLWISKWRLYSWQNQSDATTAQSETNWLMYSLTPLSFRWTVPLRKDMQHEHAVWPCGMYIYVHIRVLSHIHGHIWTYLYILICSMPNFLTKFRRMKGNKALEKNEISAKFRFVTKQKKSISGKSYLHIVVTWPLLSEYINIHHSLAHAQKSHLTNINFEFRRTVGG